MFVTLIALVLAHVGAGLRRAANVVQLALVIFFHAICNRRAATHRRAATGLKRTKKTPLTG